MWCKDFPSIFHLSFEFDYNNGFPLRILNMCVQFPPPWHLEVLFKEKSIRTKIQINSYFVFLLLALWFGLVVFNLHQFDLWLRKHVLFAQ